MITISRAQQTIEIAETRQEVVLEVQELFNLVSFLVQLWNTLVTRNILL